MKNGEKTAWQSNKEGSLEFPSLSGNLETDVVVVGGGIAGLSVAYMLSRAGRKCVVIERNEIGIGHTGLSNAHLADALDGRYFQLQKIYGTENAKLARSEEHTSELQSRENLVCRLLLEKKKKKKKNT